MESIDMEQIRKIQQHEWRLVFNEGDHRATMVNENGESMDHITFAVCLDALQNQFDDILAHLDDQEVAGPLDEETKECLGVDNYKLIVNHQNEYTREVFEVYSCDSGIYVMERFHVADNRRSYEDGFQVFMNAREADKVLESLKAYVQKSKNWNFWMDK